MTSRVTVLRRTRYSDDGYVFEVPAPALFKRSTRLYLVGSREDLFELSAQIDKWMEKIDNRKLSLEQVLIDLRQMQHHKYRFKQSVRQTLLPYRTTYRFEILKNNYGAI